MKKKILFYFLSVIIFGLVSCSESKVDYEASIIPVQVGEKWGYINIKGEYLINPQFDKADFFYDGIALVKSGDKYGYIDKKGSFIINPQFIEATPFKDGIAFTVKENEKIKSIDKKGKVINTFDFESLLVSNSDENFFLSADTTVGIVKDNGKVEANNIMQNQKYTFAGWGDDLIGFSMKSGSKSVYGFMNDEGKIVINPQYDEVSAFNDDMACVKMNDSWGVINKKGEYIINPQFDNIKIIGEGLFAINIKGNSMWGICNKKGNIVVNPQYDHIGMFGQYNLCPVVINKMVGYINKEGKIIINPQFQEASPFIDGYAVVSSGDKYGLIDKEGKYLVNPQFDNISWSMYNNWLGGLDSDYFNLDGTIADLKKNINQNSVYGISYKDNLGQLMAKFPDLTKEVILRNKYSSIPVITGKLGRGVNYMVGIEGSFSYSVPDGYWYKDVLNDSALPSGYSVDIVFSGKNMSSKEKAVLGALKKAFPGTSEDKLKINGKDWTIKTTYDGILLSYTDSGVSEAMMSEPTNVIEGEDE